MNINILAKVESWTGSPLELGPLYPFLGWEVPLFFVSLALWIGWIVWQIRTENAAYQRRVRELDSARLSEILKER